MYERIEGLKRTITRLCDERGITINKLASLSGITQSTLDSIMKGKSKNPKLETMRKISVGFSIDYNEFVMLLHSAQDDV